jgi:signal transduction histidine kinase
VPRFLISIIFTFCCIGVANATPFDTIQLKLQSLPLSQQIEYIQALPFDAVVSNSREIIPILHQFEAITKKQGKSGNLAKIYINLSLAYFYTGKYNENLFYGLKAIRLYDSLDDKRNLGTMYGELGYQMKRRDLTKAFGFMQKGIQILEKNKEIEPLAKIYDNYGVLHEINSNLDSAIYFYRKALLYKKIMNDSLGIPFSLNNIFSIKMATQQFDSAQWYLNKSTEIREKRDDRFGLAENYNYYARLHSAQADYNQSIKCNLMALEMAKKYNYAFLIQNLYQDLSVGYENLKMYDQALKYHKFFKQLQDSLINLETNKTIANLQVQFETAEKEKELLVKGKQLDREKNLKFSIAIVAVILLVSTILVFRNKLLVTKRNEKIRIQNALIEGEQTERNRLALELHDGIANDINAVIMSLSNQNEFPSGLQKGIDKLKNTHQTVRKLSHTLMPRSLKEKGLQAALNELTINFSSQNLSVVSQSVNLDGKLSQFIEFNIYRIAQETLNNIVKHSHATNVLIDCNVVDNMLMVSIEDNGIGFDSNKSLENEGMGLKNISNRVKMLNGKIQIISAKNEGTTIEVQVPLT